MKKCDDYHAFEYLKLITGQIGNKELYEFPTLSEIGWQRDFSKMSD